MSGNLVLDHFHGINIHILGYRSSDIDQADHELLYEATRTHGFGHEVQRRILLGTHVLTAG